MPMLTLAMPVVTTVVSLVIVAVSVATVVVPVHVVLMLGYAHIRGWTGFLVMLRVLMLMGVVRKLDLQVRPLGRRVTFASRRRAVL